MNTTSTLIAIGNTLGRILDRLIFIALNNTRRFDQIDRAIEDFRREAARAATLASVERSDYAHEINLKLDRLIAATLPGPAVTLYLELFDEAGNITDQGVLPMQANISRNSSRTFKLTPRDSDQNVTTLDGAMSVESANAAITLADLSVDGLSGRLVAGTKAGSGPVSFHGDADLSAGVREVAGSVDITVPAGEAVSFDIELGDEVPNQPAP